MHSLDPLFRPKSLAILGASGTPGKTGYKVLQELIDSGYRGKIYPVNPRGGEILNFPVVSKIEDLPDGVDVALCVLSSESAITAIEQCGKRGVKFAVIYTSGFSEMSEIGKDLEKQLVTAAKTYDLRIVGPNCMGIFSLNWDMMLTAIPSPPRGPIGLISQSGNVAISLCHHAKALDTGFSLFVGFGNQADLAIHEYIDYFAGDDQTEVIALYMEGLKEGDRDNFVRAARAAVKRKPVVVLKGGRTENGKRAAASHTASLSADHRLYEELFRSCGMIQVNEMEELLTISETLYRCPPARTKNVSVIGSGGGHSILATDALEQQGLAVPPYSEPIHQYMASQLSPWAPSGNPVDMAGAFKRDLDLYPTMMEKSFEDPADFGCGLAYGLYGLWDGENLVDSKGKTYVTAAPGLGELQKRSGRPIIMYSPYVENNLRCFTEMRKAGVPCYASLGTAARGLNALYQRHVLLSAVNAISDAQPKPLTPIPPEAFAAAHKRHNRFMLEPEANRILEKAGLRVARWYLAKNPEEVAIAARDINAPVVVKVVSPAIVHKSDVGGVYVNLRSPEEARNAAAKMKARLPADTPIEGFLVSEFISGAIEVFVGARRDPVFGVIVLLGLGGIYAEVMNDVAIGLAPLNPGDVEKMIDRLQSRALFHGVRGKAVAKADLIAQAVAIGNLLLANPDIEEVDLNPILLLPKESIIADARIILSSKKAN